MSTSTSASGIGVNRSMCRSSSSSARRFPAPVSGSVRLSTRSAWCSSTCRAVWATRSMPSQPIRASTSSSRVRTGTTDPPACVSSQSRSRARQASSTRWGSPAGAGARPRCRRGCARWRPSRPGRARGSRRASTICRSSGGQVARLAEGVLAEQAQRLGRAGPGTRRRGRGPPCTPRCSCSGTTDGGRSSIRALTARRTFEQVVVGLAAPGRHVVQGAGGELGGPAPPSGRRGRAAARRRSSPRSARARPRRARRAAAGRRRRRGCRAAAGPVRSARRLRAARG